VIRRRVDVDSATDGVVDADSVGAATVRCGASFVGGAASMSGAVCVARRGVERSTDRGHADQRKATTTAAATTAVHRVIRRGVSSCPTSRA
jgi:hypothetical protein